MGPFERDYHTEDEMEKQMLEQCEQAREDDRVQREAVGFGTHFLAGVTCLVEETEHGPYVHLTAGPIHHGAMPGSEDAVCLHLIEKAINTIIRLERAGAVEKIRNAAGGSVLACLDTVSDDAMRIADILAECLGDGE